MKICCLGLILGIMIGSTAGFKVGCWYDELMAYRAMYGHMTANTNVSNPRQDAPVADAKPVLKWHKGE